MEEKDIYTNEGPVDVVADLPNAPIASYLGKDTDGNLLTGRALRYKMKDDANKLIAQNTDPINEGFRENISRNNRKFNKIYNREKRRDQWENRKYDPNNRVFYRNLNNVAKAYTRGEIQYDDIHDAYKPYIAETVEKQQERAYNQYLGQQYFDQIMRQKGWDKLEKAYGIGMSSLIALPVLSQVATSAIPEWTSSTLSTAPTFNPANFVPFGQHVGIWTHVLKQFPTIIGGMIGNEVVQGVARRNGHDGFADWVHRGVLKNENKPGFWASTGYEFLNPGNYVGGWAGNKLLNVNNILNLNSNFKSFVDRVKRPYYNYKYGDANRVKLIRNLDVVPTVSKDGFVQFTPDENLFENFTTDITFRRHPRYTRRPEHVIMFDAPKVGNARPISVEPSDTFFIKGDLQIKPQDVTFVSGDAKALIEAYRRGFRIKLNPRLFYERLKYSLGKRSKFSKGFSEDVTITPIIDNMFRQRPRYKDYKQLGKLWGVEFPVIPNYPGAADDYSIITKLKDAPNFKYVAYHPASSIESDFTLNLDLENTFKDAGLVTLGTKQNPPKFQSPISAHPRYSVEDMPRAINLMKEYVSKHPIKSSEYFSSLTNDGWNELYWNLRGKYLNYGRTESDFKKLQILRDKFSRIKADRAGLVRTIDSNGNYVYTDPKTGKQIIKSSEPMTYEDDGLDINISDRDNFLNLDSRY